MSHRFATMGPAASTTSLTFREQFCVGVEAPWQIAQGAHLHGDEAGRRHRRVASRQRSDASPEPAAAAPAGCGRRDAQMRHADRPGSNGFNARANA